MWNLQTHEPHATRHGPFRNWTTRYCNSPNLHIRGVVGNRATGSVDGLCERIRRRSHQDRLSMVGGAGKQRRNELVVDAFPGQHGNAVHAWSQRVVRRPLSPHRAAGRWCSPPNRAAARPEFTKPTQHGVSGGLAGARQQPTHLGDVNIVERPVPVSTLSSSSRSRARSRRADSSSALLAWLSSDSVPPAAAAANALSPLLVSRLVLAALSSSELRARRRSRTDIPVGFRPEGEDGAGSNSSSL